MMSALPAACWVAAIAWISFSIRWISSSLQLWSLISLVAAVGAFVVVTFAVAVAAKGASTDPGWVRAINFVIVAVLTVSGGLITLSLVLTGGDLADAALGAAMIWIFVHLPFYSFLPRGANWLSIVLGTAMQWTIIGLLIARVTRGARTSSAVALSSGVILAVAALVTSALLLLGFRTWFDTP